VSELPRRQRLTAAVEHQGEVQTMADAQLPARAPLPDDIADMNDDEFLAYCRRVRSLRERTKPDEVTSELQDEFVRVNREFMRRAGMAWQAV